MTESDPAPVRYDAFLELDLAGPENEELADHGVRILKLLECRETQHNQFLSPIRRLWGGREHVFGAMPTVFAIARD
jgi:hypothetical protein